jgi:hypothetical protein
MSPDEDRLLALGRVVDAASKLEMSLRAVFCALVGSKFASVIAGGQMANWLIENSKALIDAHAELLDEQRQQLKELLSASQAANTKRNRLVHDMWSVGADGSYAQLQSKARSYDLAPRQVSVADAEQAATELTSCSVNLISCLWEILPGEIGTEVQLRWEDHLKSMPPDERAALIARRQRVASQDDQ